MTKGAHGNGMLLRAAVAALAAVLCADTLADESPSWWYTRNVVSSTAMPSDYSPLVLGQLKWMATNACDELAASVAGGAGTSVWALVRGFSTLSNNWVAVNVGQLKAVATNFYDRLYAVHYFTNAWYYPWTAATNDNRDYALANLGQLKNVFNFDLRYSVSGDSDGDGLANWVESGTGVFIGPYNTGTSFATTDTDHDGVSDGAEVAARTDPCSSDTTRPMVRITAPANNYQGVGVP